MNEIKEYTNKMFEDIKYIDENGNEYWLARELQDILGYHQWWSIDDLIERAKTACKESKHNIDDHFAVQRKMVEIGSKTKRKVLDYKLSRYACYLIVMNGNPKKEIIALGQTYFAIQTRKQELTEKEYSELTEDEKRIYRRNQARKGNYNLNKTAVKAHVKDLARFHNAGYKGLYNGETADAKLKRDKVDNEYTANSVHYEVGREVRESIKRLGGTMPENLPTPNRSLKKLEKDNKKLKEWWINIKKKFKNKMFKIF